MKEIHDDVTMDSDAENVSIWLEIFSASLALFEGKPPMTGALTKGQWRGALMSSLVCALANSWINNRDAGDLRRHRSHYYVTVMVRAATCPVAHINVHLYISVQKTQKTAKDDNDHSNNDNDNDNCTMVLVMMMKTMMIMIIIMMMIIKHENNDNNDTNKTRMWNMISSTATPTVCLEQKSENFQSRNVTLSMPSPSQKQLYLR